MTHDPLRELARLAEKATEGPWHLGREEAGCRSVRGPHRKVALIYTTGLPDDDTDRNNALFVEAARNSIEALKILLAESSELRDRLRAAEEVVDAAILMPFELNKMVETPVSHELAVEYRQRFPSAPEITEEGKL